MNHKRPVSRFGLQLALLGRIKDGSAGLGLSWRHGLQHHPVGHQLFVETNRFSAAVAAPV
jgi:hypothetical protein